MGRKLPLFPFARVVVNQRHASCGQDFLTDHRAAVSSVHQFVAGIDPLATDAYERYGDPTVMHVRARKNGADGHTAASRIQVQLVVNGYRFIRGSSKRSAETWRVEFQSSVLSVLTVPEQPVVQSGGYDANS